MIAFIKHHKVSFFILVPLALLLGAYIGLRLSQNQIEQVSAKFH